jgi:hypothetical protein
MRYYYSLANQALGPVPLEQLHQLYRVGTIKPDTLVAAEGASEWRTYSVLFPAGAATSGAMPAAASPVFCDPAVAATPLPRDNTSAPPQDYRQLVLISWILLGATALVSVVPILGCVSWLLLVPVFLATVAMGVMVLMRGGTQQGVMILIAAVVVLPVFTIVAPILTTALFGAVTGAGEKAKSEKASPRPDATAAPRSGGGIAAVSGDLPDASTATAMVNNTMVSFKDAVNSGSFEAFYRTQLSDRWKREITPARLKTTFAAFMDKKIDLAPIFSVQPAVEPPHIDEDDFLVLKGQYSVPAENVSVFFDLSYSREGSWKLSGINVNVKPTDE